MPASDPIAPAPPMTGLTATASAVFTARIDPAGPNFEAPASLSLLQAAQIAGLEMASSCRNGTCRTCICELTSGEVVYRIDWPGLSAEEKQEGFILPCVAYPVSDVVLELPL